MNRNTNLCVDLKTIMQEDILLNQGQCYRGVLTRLDEDRYLFEEAVQKDNHGHRNPKLYEGKHVSLVHMTNGRYQIHMRTIEASTDIDRKELAFRVYSELLEAFDIITL